MIIRVLTSRDDVGCDAGTDRVDMPEPLKNAACQGRAECLRSLMQRGADVNKRDVVGCTAAHYAAGQGHREALLVLLDAGM